MYNRCFKSNVPIVQVAHELFNRSLREFVQLDNVYEIDSLVKLIDGYVERKILVFSGLQDVTFGQQ